MARRRFQEGQMYRKSKNWIGRWREDIVAANGSVRRVRRARVIGSIRELPTKPLAKRKLQLVLAPVNDPAYRPGRISPDDRTQNVLNIQPVIPARIGKNWNLITRVITPIVYQPLPATEGQIEFVLGKSLKISAVNIFRD